MKYVDLAKIAYEEYAGYTNWKNYQGLQMPQWNDLPSSIQNAWIAASAGVVDVVLKNTKEVEMMAQTEIVPTQTVV